MCQCGESCQNRVVQRGLQFRLEVFKTVKKGWGLRTLEFIAKGRFVCEYAGEVLGFNEARRRIQAQTSKDSNYIIAVREHLHNGQSQTVLSRGLSFPSRQRRLLHLHRPCTDLTCPLYLPERHFLKKSK
ncbi:histone-lysine N-methyltransferase SETMAR [Apteryx rowi]|nr:histone-lysine N-methyltransferase SETMAR [Apteryx rowi]